MLNALASSMTSETMSSPSDDATEDVGFDDNPAWPHKTDDVAAELKDLLGQVTLLTETLSALETKNQALPEEMAPLEKTHTPLFS